MAGMDKNTFWELIAQAKAVCGQNLEASAEWIKGQLLALGPEQALNFEHIRYGYFNLAYRYGLWTAAASPQAALTRFRLVAKARPLRCGSFPNATRFAGLALGPRIARPGGPRKAAFQALWGEEERRNERAPALAAGRGICSPRRRGEGINYPYTWSETAEYLPRLCGKYVPPQTLAWLIQHHDDTWNPICQEVWQARATAVKGRKKNRGGDAR